MQMFPTKVVVTWMAVILGSCGHGHAEPLDLKKPGCSVSIVLEGNSLQPGEDLDATFILKINSSSMVVFNPFLTEGLPVFVRIQVLSEKGELVSELLSPTRFDKLPIPPPAEWQFFDRDSLVGHRFVFSATDQNPSLVFLKHPGRYRIRAQVLKQMLGNTLYYEGQLISERIAERWPLENGTEIAVESDLVPFEVIAMKEETPKPSPQPKEPYEVSDYGLRLRIARSIGSEKTNTGNAFFWVANSFDTPRVLSRVFSYHDTYSFPLHWSERVMGDSYRELDLIRLAPKGEPRDYSSIYVELPKHGICGRVSSVPSASFLRPGTEIIAQVQGHMLGTPAPQVAADLLKRGRITQAGLDNCKHLTNKDIVATSNRLTWMP